MAPGPRRAGDRPGIAARRAALSGAGGSLRHAAGRYPRPSAMCFAATRSRSRYSAAVRVARSTRRRLATTKRPPESWAFT